MTATRSSIPPVCLAGAGMRSVDSALQERSHNAPTMLTSCHDNQSVKASGPTNRGLSHMHMLAILVALVVGAGVWYWRFGAVKELTDDVGDAVGRIRGQYRMSQFRKQAQGSALTKVSDPALAAAIFFFALANEDDVSLHLSEPVIGDQISRIVPDEERDEIMAYARWAAGEVVDARDVVRRFKPLWREKLTREERASLVTMAEAVASVGSGADHNQKLSIASLRMALGPDQNR